MQASPEHPLDPRTEELVERTLALADARLAEADARLEEADARLAEADERLVEAVNWLIEGYEERDRINARHAERVAAFAASEAVHRARIDEMNRLIDGLTARLDELTRRDAEQEARLVTARLRIEELSGTAGRRARRWGAA